ncbi:GNAT family N-acetyltransferase [Nocardioides marmorisolisilvae]|uniref:GNAT family N-acetyltransferase n=1 Tax=Nocardioides marmorisolisilvae TaxID=1542737 RepID=A0A3N0DQ23_9ACTN|nr:GNAT family N-acetyltransferase [Nocardioides marmorisolisilvae]RNL77742.1 GNAT family N-acetyltransferase [Nocardioides marmorisolisilvae]
MAITLETATPGSLDEVVEAVALWQHDGGGVQVHPGDLGWNWSFGADRLAQDVRFWRRDGEIVAAGMVDDESRLIRMSLSEAVGEDEEFAQRLHDDLVADAGVLPGGVSSVEARYGPAFRDLLRRTGWTDDEPWAPLVLDLGEPVPEHGLRIEIAGPDDVEERAAVQRAAFPTSTFSPERWHAMAAAAPYRRARCLLGYDERGNAVATTTVWSAGPGRPGLIEPLGVHHEHRGHGHGVSITRAAAVALRELGSSMATVCTPAANTGGVAAYAAAGFERLPDATDFRRPD